MADIACIASSSPIVPSCGSVRRPVAVSIEERSRRGLAILRLLSVSSRTPDAALNRKRLGVCSNATRSHASRVDNPRGRPVKRPGSTSAQSHGTTVSRAACCVYCSSICSLPETPPLIPAAVDGFRSGPEAQARVTRKRSSISGRSGPGPGCIGVAWTPSLQNRVVLETEPPSNPGRFNRRHDLCPGYL